METMAPVTHFLPLTTIRRERVLPVPGKIMVRKGQKVSASDAVAEANLSPSHQLLEVARGLGLRSDQADEYLQVEAGTIVAAGDVIAGPVGITRRVVRAPQDGRVILAGGGQALIELKSPIFELRAGIPGVITDLINDRGVVIETVGALVQGVWGNGHIDFGLMFVLAKNPDDELDASQLDVSMRGSIVLGGYVDNAEVLSTASEMPLRGLILASMNPALIPMALNAKFPLLIVDGFGVQPMNSAAFKLLATNERREVALNAESWDRYNNKRPEVVIPLPAASPPPLASDTVVFAPGKQVRVLRAPYSGKIGTLVDLRSSAVFPNGLRAMAAEVRLEDGDNAVLPLANLEVLE
jgi:hypothetical protein